MPPDTGHSGGMARAASRLVGRDAELGRLGHAAERAHTGARTAVVIEGDAGLGKTRLLADALAIHHHPADVVELGYGVELTGGQIRTASPPIYFGHWCVTPGPTRSSLDFPCEQATKHHMMTWVTWCAAPRDAAPAPGARPPAAPAYCGSGATRAAAAGPGSPSRRFPASSAPLPRRGTADSARSTCSRGPGQAHRAWPGPLFACGAGGNRTRVLERRTRSSPGAVRDVAFLGPGARTDTSPTGSVTGKSRSSSVTWNEQQVS